MARNTQKTRVPQASSPTPSPTSREADLPAPLDQQENPPATLGGPSLVPPHPPTEIIQIPEIPDIPPTPFPFSEVSVDENGVIQIK